MHRRALLKGAIGSTLALPGSTEGPLKSDAYYRTFWAIHNGIMSLDYSAADAADIPKLQADMVAALRDVANRVEATQIVIDRVSVRAKPGFGRGLK